MFNLRLATYVFTAPTVAGILVIAALTANMFDGKTITYAAVGGALLALPLAWIIAAKIANVTKSG